MVASDINATNESISGGKSFYTILEMTTTNTKLSPVLDTQRMSAFTIQNRLNSLHLVTHQVLFLMKQTQVHHLLLYIVQNQYY